MTTDGFSVLGFVLTVVLGSAAAFCWYAIAKPFGRVLKLGDDLSDVERPLDRIGAEKGRGHPTQEEESRY